MREGRWDGLAAVALGFSLGLLVAVISAMFIPGWSHLPVGSLSAGVMAGLYFTRHRRMRPLWFTMLACACAGVCGWVFLVVLASL